ncbi:MAG TPA: GNAT family N-acetyltransferase [Gaiellaceae bacterium]|nr:GNAT family N-acetyltransferase [Gaiellaceae bacterium]
MRLPTLGEIAELASLAQAGVHSPELMPFRVPWTDRAGEPRFFEDVVEPFHRGARENWRVESWALLLAVWFEGQVIGAQDVRGEDFAARRSFETGSWLGQRFQGHGLGTEMRHGVLALGFAGLGARVAVSGAFEGNIASERVSEKLGYRAVGEAFYAPRGVPVREQIFALDRETWEAQDRPPVEIDGLEPCLALFGL